MWKRSFGTSARSAASRSARRRGRPWPPHEPLPASCEPLPALVCPDDDREFAEPPERPVPEPTTA